MYSFVFVTHGKLGEALIHTAEFIMKQDMTERAKVFSVDYSMLSDMNKLQEEISLTVDAMLAKNHKVVVFVDLFGGSPSNLAFTLAKKENVDIISGANLPMVIQTFEKMDSDQDITEFISSVVQCGSESIVSAKKLLLAREKK